jgi:hypothetical protein
MSLCAANTANLPAGQTQVRVGGGSRRSGRGQRGVGGEGGEARRASCTRLVRILCYGNPGSSNKRAMLVTNTKNEADGVGMCERLCGGGCRMHGLYVSVLIQRPAGEGSGGLR